MELSESKAAVLKRRQRTKYPEKERARNLLTKAVRSGKIKYTKCSVIGCRRDNIEAHHPDYSRPLEVVGLCQYHHKLFHKKWMAK